ncbi:conserved hypothetical protein [Vibrio coralliirubri]|nr:conserved hypothetical protein [Vibrio coralliirubri]
MNIKNHSTRQLAYKFINIEWILFSGVEHLLGLFLRPEVNVELCVVAKLYSMPILRRACGKLPSFDCDNIFWFCRFCIGKTVEGDSAFHYTDLAEYALSGIVMIEKRCRYVVLGEKWSGTLNFPV